MIICTKCFIEKLNEDFSWRNKNLSRRQSWCKTCIKEHDAEKFSFRKEQLAESNKDRRIRNSLLVYSYLQTQSCIDCGESDPIVLEFDHRETSTKIDSVSNLARGSGSMVNIMNEIMKCDIRCANCHRRKTAIQLGWYANIADDLSIL